MDYIALKAELVSDPLGLGYAAMNAKDAAAKLNEVPAQAMTGRKMDRGEVASRVVYDALDADELATLTDSEQMRLNSLLGMGTLWLKGENTRKSLNLLFPSDIRPLSRAAIVALRNVPISRSEFLGFGSIEYWDVERARAL